MSPVKLKLSIMMFLQYAIWGAWAVPMGAYLGGLGFSGADIGLIYGTTALAAMISPLYTGFLADRMFATEKMIAILHFVGAALMLIASQLTGFSSLYPVMIVYALCYMPTLALTNSISFANISDSEKEFPPIRVWGTWGWIVVGWIVGFILQNPGLKGSLPAVVTAPNSPLILSALFSLALGVHALSLPHTPPAGKNAVADTGDKQGVLQLLKDPSFLLFVICSFLVCIPLTFYYGFANIFLGEIDAPYPAALQTLGQISEVGFMAAMPWFIQRLGVKKMLAVGMAAWVIRYFCFGTLTFPAALFGLFLHGICYDFFFVASQIYVDSRATAATRASAQSFIAFVTLGVGMFVGNYLAGKIVDMYPPKTVVKASMKTAEGTVQKDVLLPNWDLEGKTGLAAELKLKPEDLLTADAIRNDLTENAGKENETVYRAEDLKAAIAAADLDKNGKVSRDEWRAAQRKDWFHIWLWPALMALATLAVFWLGFRDSSKNTAVAATH
jgi:nucleoside transporter